MIVNTTNYVVMKTGSMGNHIFEQLKLYAEYMCNNLFPCLLRMPRHLDLILQVLCPYKRFYTKIQHTYGSVQVCLQLTYSL